VDVVRIEVLEFSKKEGMKTLSDVSDGECVRVECLRGEISDCQRLREMGFCELAQVQKITGSGALICKVCNTRVVISKELAKNIVVEVGSSRKRE
jgi:ferrous iron transport protein A